MKKYFSWKLLTIILVSLFLGFFDLPDSAQKAIVPFTPESITRAKINLGLDLQGGSQLDYKIDLRKVPEGDREQIIEGVQEVIEKRVNGLGVAEPNIYRAEIADETHIIVELAENATITEEDIQTYLNKDISPQELTDDQRKEVSLEKAKAIVGKTIQLEFKEEKAEMDPQEKERVKENAQKALDRIKGGSAFSVVGQEEEQATPGKVRYEVSDFVFADEMPSNAKDFITSLTPGQHTQELVEIGGGFIIDESGRTIEDSGLGIFKLLETKEDLKNEKEVDVSHILIAWQGAERADASVTRTKEEAFEQAKNIKEQLKENADFTELVKKYSDEPGSEETGGTLSTPVTGDGKYAFNFEEAAMKLKAGEISDIVETQFGYHIIKSNAVREDVKATKYKYESIVFSTVPDAWQETGLTGKNFVHADVSFNQIGKPYITIQFDEEGAKLFQELTKKNVGKRIAIFVGGTLVSAPNVNEEIPGGIAQITGDFTLEETRQISRDLNTGAIPAPIVLTGEYTIGATLGQQALNTSLLAGAIGIILVILFMIGYYRMLGAIASIALAIYAIILIFMIKSHLNIILALIISLAIFTYTILKLLNNKDSGWEKFISFVISCFAFFFIVFLLKTGVVMTLAGVAGIILSIGMAVDANILIFERFKEEMRNGKTFAAALDTGFDRAWSAIRDSNFSTLITCAILFYFGSSIIKGFAFNLAAGILVSMFSAIVITKTLLSSFIGTKISKNIKLFGFTEKEKPRKNFDFIKNSKIFLAISGAMVALAIIFIGTFGLKLGIDFQGGTLMEFTFEQPVTKEQINEAFQNAEEKVNTVSAPTPEVHATTENKTPELEKPTESDVDFQNITIQQSGDNNFIIKTKYLTSEAHDRLLPTLKETLPEFQETRFTTIGPVIGQTLLQKALVAIIFALAVIIFYIALAFRKVPKHIGPWKFGATAIAALFHDLIIVIGIFAVLGQVLNVEIDALFITAMLTVFGYSVNDTIVVFDRLRENLTHKSDNLEKVANDSLNETLARSINTSLSTLIALIAVLLFGSDSIFYFVLALTLGILVGTYSSIFTATPLLVLWQKQVEKYERKE